MSITPEQMRQLKEGLLAPKPGFVGRRYRRLLGNPTPPLVRAGQQTPQIAPEWLVVVAALQERIGEARRPDLKK